MLKKPLVLSLVLWSLLFLPLLIARRTLILGGEIAKLSNEKIKGEGIYSTLLKKENLLKYTLIRGEINVAFQKSEALASLPYRDNSPVCIHFVFKDTVDLANR